MGDEDIDFSDLPEVPPEMFAKALVRKGLKPVPRAATLGAVAALLANLVILAPLAVAKVLQSWPDLYYRSVQEDEIFEWTSFWAFLMAAAIALLAGVRQRSATGRFPWFLWGVALFSFFVAMEEISWGQRLVGYRPPVYFLEHNFQQEANVHNIVATNLRKLAFKGVLLGYGVALPLLALVLPRRLLARLRIVAPPWTLTPSFGIAFLAYESYPWKFSGEWVELMLGLGFLFAAIAAALPLRSAESPATGFSRPLVLVAGAAILVVVLGAANTAVSRGQRGAQPEILELARIELEAMQRDFQSGKVQSRCNRHKRVYTFKEKYEQDHLLVGQFAALTEQGLPEERAEFFLDPWNSPYWIRDRCSEDKSRRIVFVYSFGPNRRRESTRWEILGDDVGAVILSQGFSRRSSSSTPRGDPSSSPSGR
jgi:hypothetical protein